MADQQSDDLRSRRAQRKDYAFHDFNMLDRSLELSRFWLRRLQPDLLLDHGNSVSFRDAKWF